MTPQQKYLVRRTFSRLETMGTLPALVFYRRLFDESPHLRALFRSDIEAQAARLLDMLSLLISHLERSESLAAELRLLGQRHAGYGVRLEHYQPVGVALLGMLSEMLGDDFTPEVRDAWTALYEAVASAMTSAPDALPAA